VRIASIFLRLVGVLFFGCAAIAAIRLGLADTLFRQDTPEAIRKAIHMQWPTPADELERRLADLDPVHAREALESAVGANPRSSAAWISLGLLDEAAGDLPAAETELRQAGFVDRQYLPAWSLANFYFRRQNREAFWEWTDRAASLDYDDLRPLLRLCDAFEPNPARMLGHFRDPRRLRPPYLDFLIGENRLDDAQLLARTMTGERANDPLLIDLADRQLRAGHARSAIELWNIASGLGPIEPSAGKILTNGDLARAPLNLGFDWRVGQTEGVGQRWKPSELMFSLSGSQPEACVLLEQTISLTPRRFRLRFDYRTAEWSSTGIHWSLENIEGPQIEPSAQWKEGAFDLPRADGLRNLRLFYRREPGTIRTEGRIEIRNLRLEAS
jgi:hypothetical protein